MLENEDDKKSQSRYSEIHSLNSKLKTKKNQFWGPNPSVGALINQWLCGRLMDCPFLVAGEKLKKCGKISCLVNSIK